MSLDEPSEFLKVFQGKHANWAKRVKIITFGGAGAAIGLPHTLTIAPAFGGVIGAKLFGLAGAAATSKGLAFLGGGAVAAGGFGMAGGTAVLAALGGSLGGTLGGVVANSCYGSVKDFEIRKVRPGSYPAMATINGFLSQRHQDTSDWASFLPKHFDDRAWYHVNWESKNLAKLGQLACEVGGSAALIATLQTAAKLATKAGAKKAGANFFGVLGLYGIATNPWHVTLTKAQMTAVMLADVLSRCPDRRFILFGHSLGARVIFELLRTVLSDAQLIEEAHLLGGAVGNDTQEWSELKQKVNGPIYNYHSDNDSVLKYMYSVGTLFTNKPIGRHPIEGVDGIENIDVAEVVKGHMDYKTSAVRDFVY